MRDFVYIAPSFTREESINTILSIRLTTGGHCFSIRKGNEVQYLFSKDVVTSSLDEQVDQLFDSLERQSLNGLIFSQVNIYYAGAHKMLIPQSEVDAGREKIWLKTLSASIVESNHIKVPIEECKALLFSETPASLERVSALGESFTLEDTAARFIINSLRSIPSKHRGSWLFVDYSRGVLDVVVTKGCNLLFYNSYNVKQSEEVLYYVLQVIRLHELADRPNAVFSGETMCGDDMIYATLRRYIPSFVLGANLLLKGICNDTNMEVMSKFVHL